MRYTKWDCFITIWFIKIYKFLNSEEILRTNKSHNAGTPGRLGTWNLAVHRVIHGAVTVVRPKQSVPAETGHSILLTVDVYKNVHNVVNNNPHLEMQMPFSNIRNTWILGMNIMGYLITMKMNQLLPNIPGNPLKYHKRRARSPEWCNS